MILTVVLVAVQNYITAIIIFLIIEMLMTWGFYGEQTFKIDSKIGTDRYRFYESTRV